MTSTETLLTKMKSRLLLDVVTRNHAAVFELLTSEDKVLLMGKALEEAVSLLNSKHWVV